MNNVCRNIRISCWIKLWMTLVVDTETYEVFYMSVFQDRPVSEISLVTRKSPGSIYAIRHRCLKKLKYFINLYRQYEENELASGLRQSEK